MNSIRDLLFAPEVGLISYLDAKLGSWLLQDDWNRFQIRGWSFDTPGDTSGFRLREARTKVVAEQYIETTQTIILGKIMIYEQPNCATNADAGRLREKLDRIIVEWSHCQVPGLAVPVTQIGGTILTLQDKNISSEQQGAWAMIVVREFEITYVAENDADEDCAWP